MNLIGTTAIVTGASKGIGYAVAAYLMQHGADVVVTARSEDALTSAAEELSATHGRRAVPVVCDVSDATSVAHLFDRATAELGDIAILVNNAGNSTLDTIDNLAEADWDSVIDTHLKGTFLCTQAAITHMRTRGIKGVIVNTSSVEAVATTRGNAHYSAAKAGIDKFTEVAALEGGRHGIRVNGVAPGIIVTPMTQAAATEEFHRAWQQTFSVDRFGEPDDIAKAVTFLASDYAPWITGITLLVDGGTHLRGLPDYAEHLLPGTN
ncbi:SDR family NAD(P)-dependent oxidoreductase [Streptomyces sp. NPDC092369]|uniref:SDR family NAD(P)-dependent oxidoreductase n=1 Tax=Streptomyces sp. NPDC092369 TaxID=3366015 RepID=UPI0038297DEE